MFVEKSRIRKFNMAIFVSIFFTIMFGLISYSCFHQAFKAFKNRYADDFDSIDIDLDIFSIMLLLIEILLWICKKVFPYKIYRNVFIITSFLIGLVFLILIILIWAVIPFKY